MPSSLSRSQRGGEALVARHIYELRVTGTLGPAALESFADVTITVEPATTVFTADLNQKQLHALLDRVRGFGLELFDLRQLPEPVP